jgi:hypothetical protein
MAAAADAITSSSSSSSNSQAFLHMAVQAEEDDAMAALGYLHERRPSLSSCELAVSPRVSGAAVAEHVRMLYMFGSLAALQLRCVSRGGASKRVRTPHAPQHAPHQRPRATCVC